MMTETQAEKARQDLAEFEARKAAEARAAENEKRAAARAAFDPLAKLMPSLTAAATRLERIVETGMDGERGLMDLSRNVLIVVEGLADRLKRRVEDTEPVPEPAAEPGPVTPAPTAA